MSEPMSDMNSFTQGYTLAEGVHSRYVKVHLDYIDLCDGNLHTALVFSRIMHWHGVNPDTGKQRLRVSKNGHLWLVKGYGDWYEECRVNESTARNAIRRLKELELIVTKTYKFGGVPKLHIRVNWQVFQERMSGLVENDKSTCSEITGPFDTREQVHPFSRIRSSTNKTTNKTTKEARADGDAPPSTPMTPTPAADDDQTDQPTEADAVRSESPNSGEGNCTPASNSGTNAKGKTRRRSAKQRARDEMSNALLRVCFQRDPDDWETLDSVSQSNVRKATTKWITAGATAPDLLAFGEWWYTHDWRGQQGSAPTLAQIGQEWGAFEASRTGEVHQRRYDESEVFGG